jgi:hypothetical protein
MGFKIGIKLLGFKDRHELAFEDNIKHSQFIYPDEMVRIVPHCFILYNCLDLEKKKTEILRKQKDIQRTSEIDAQEK